MCEANRIIIESIRPDNENDRNEKQTQNYYSTLLRVRLVSIATETVTASAAPMNLWSLSPESETAVRPGGLGP